MFLAIGFSSVATGGGGGGGGTGGQMWRGWATVGWRGNSAVGGWGQLGGVNSGGVVNL